MTHTIHHTEGIVLCSIDAEESHRFLHLFTKDFGFIVAHARGIRELKSKLRYSLQDFSYSHIDLVFGRGGWRIVNAIEQKKLFPLSLHAYGAQQRAEIIARITLLLRRLLKGEEKNEPLFSDVTKGFALLSSEEPSLEDALALEVALVIRILNHLGYWGDDALLSPFLAGDITSSEHIERVKKQKPRAIRAINKALQETQL